MGVEGGVRCCNLAAIVFGHPPSVRGTVEDGGECLWSRIICGLQPRAAFPPTLYQRYPAYRLGFTVTNVAWRLISVRNEVSAN